VVQWSLAVSVRSDLCPCTWRLARPAARGTKSAKDRLVFHIQYSASMQQLYLPVDWGYDDENNRNMRYTSCRTVGTSRQGHSRDQRLTALGDRLHHQRFLTTRACDICIANMSTLNSQHSRAIFGSHVCQVTKPEDTAEQVTTSLQDTYQSPTTIAF